MEAQKKRRAHNYTDDELRVLVNEVRKRKDVVLGKLIGDVTSKKKNLAWEAISDAVNAVSPVQRSVEDNRKKFHDFKSYVRKKEFKRKLFAERTGANPCELDRYASGEVIMLAFLNESSHIGLNIPESETALPSLTALETKKLLQLENQMDRDTDDSYNLVYCVKGEADEIDIHHEDITVDLEEVESDDVEDCNEEMEDDEIDNQARWNESIENQEKDHTKRHVTSPDVRYVHNYSPKVTAKPRSKKRFKRDSQCHNEGPSATRDTLYSSVAPSIDRERQYARVNPYRHRNNSYLDTAPLSERSTQCLKLMTPSLENVFSKFFAKKANDEDDPDLLFFRGLLPDIKKLSDKHKRTFKANVISNMNSLLDQQEIVCEQSVLSEHSDDSAKSQTCGTVVMNGHIDSSNGMLVASNLENVSEIRKVAEERKTT